MKPMKLRLAAILTALLLVLGMAPALAEQAPVSQQPTAGQLLENLFASGQSLQTEVTIQVNPMLGNMLMGFGNQEPDEASMALATTLVNAVNKLKATFLANKAGVSGTIGTAAASLLDFQVAMNEQTKENHITSSLLPGIALSVDPAVLNKINPSAQMTPEQVQQMVMPYVAAFQSYVDEVNQQIAREEDSFEIAGIGTFTKRYQLNTTTHMVAGFLERFATVYQNDENLKKLVEEAAKANQSMDITGEAQVEVPQDLGQSMLDAAKEIRDKEDQVILLGTAYEDETGRTFAELVTPEGQEQAIKIDLLMNGAQSQGQPGPVDFSAKILVKNNQPAAEGETIPATDWLALENEIKAGQNYSDILINLSFALKPELPKLASTFSLGLNTSGVNIGLNYSDNSDVATLESQGALSLNFMTPDPMLTVNFATKPTADQPIAPLLDGASAVVLTDGEMSEETGKLLEASLQQALPALMERLSAALPEEAPSIMALLNPEPMVEPEVVEDGGQTESELPEGEPETAPAEGEATP